VTQAQEGARLTAVGASTTERSQRRRTSGRRPDTAVREPLTEKQIRHWLLEGGLARELDGRLVATPLGRDLSWALGRE
jgi:hypothetical protein